MSTDTASDALPAGLSGHAFSSLFQAVGGLRNRPAIVAMLGCTFVGILVAGLLLAMSGTLGFVASLLAFLVWIVAIGTGVNAAGLLQMDRARGISPRSLADALVFGLMCIPKLIVLGLALVAVEIAVFIALALLMLICKIPFLGPLLFVVVFPLSVVVAGVTITGLFICMVLSLPAIWQGASITRALAQTFAIVKSRLVEAVLLLVFLGFLCFAVGFIIFGVLAAGLLPTIGMSLSIVGFGGIGMDSMMAMAQGGGGGHAIAGAIGGALLWAVAASLVGQVYLLGLSLVYLRVTEGLDLTASEAALRATFDDAKRRTAELGEKARRAAQRDGAAAAGAASVGAASSVGAALAPTPAPVPSVPAPPPPVYNPPPAFSAAPAPTFDKTAGDPFAAIAPVDESTVMPAPKVAPPVVGDTDIALPFDDVAPAAAAPSYGAPPAWTPPPAAAPTTTALPAATPLPAITTCPQCLSPVTPDDVFCGVCGYRLK
ncbi:MAG TPA: zinc ribbon domain-containing protein [Caldimonas sp.]